MPKKTPRPRPLSGAGPGKGPGARVFQGPVRPVMNSNDHFIPGILYMNRMQDELEVPYCNMCTCSGNGTQEWAVHDLLCLVDLYLVYLI